MYKFTALLITVLLLGFSITQAQNYSTAPIVVNGVDEGPADPNALNIKTSTVSFGHYYGRSATWTVDNITDRKTGYDYQSNASTQEVWLDLNNPEYLHAVFTNSQVDDNAWADRTSLYFGSTDAGMTWFELGGVPVNTGASGRSGYCCLVGNSQGAAVIADHNNADQALTVSTIFIDNSFFEYNFTNHVPPVYNPQNQGALIWPRLAISPNNDIVYASSINGGDSMYTNTLSSAGVFGDLQVLNGDQAETHSLAFSESGAKAGIAYLGGLGQDMSAFYRESNDNGATWSDPDTVWLADLVTNPDSLIGCLRGVYLTFLGEDPYVVFETGVNSYDPTGNGFYPQFPSEIRLWSPALNGGEPMVLADDTNVPFYENGFPPNFGVSDVQFALSRPVIGRSDEPYNWLFVAFNATNGQYWPEATSNLDSTAYYMGMFMMSTDAGETWTDPERFTGDNDFFDWRGISIVPVSPVTNNGTNDVITVHLTAVGDSIPGSTVNGYGIMPELVSAQYYHFSASWIIESNKDDIIANSFSLEQNYPNPFNPSTTINYTLAESSPVTIKVYDVLGSEVATLVNTTQEAGKHNITFDASKLASGLYIYTLNAGSFTSSKKMMLLK